MSIRSYIAANRARFMEEWASLIRIPSISCQPAHKDDMLRCAERWRELLLEAGAQHAEIMPSAGNPFVYAEYSPITNSEASDNRYPIEIQDKRHLYAHGGEDLFFQPAEERCIFEYQGVKILLLVCYDLRFPVWARNQSGSDYDIILVVANWPDIRIQYWDALIAARATENQCYIAAVNCVGDDGMGLHYNGHSVAYDTRLQPIVSFADDEEGTKIADFDIAKLHHFREVLPLWKDVDHFELKK